MGWNSWTLFRTEIHEELILAQAEAMVTSGMAQAGYQYVNVDDGWSAGRHPDGSLRPHQDRFPHGMAAVADRVHELGLKFGIYASPGENTCAGYAGSLGHERQDAETFASWGVDFLKYDWCHATTPAQPTFELMRDALLETGRDIVLSINAGGSSRESPWSHDGDGTLWGLGTAHLWRNTNDAYASWTTDNPPAELAISSIIDRQVGMERYSRPGNWNDPDMLVVGHDGLTDEEIRSQFSLWCLLAAPLLASNDLTRMTEATHRILTNEAVIAVDQDPLGQQGYLLRRTGQVELWARPLSHGGAAAVLLNRGTEATTGHLAPTELPTDGPPTRLVNLWTGEDIDTGARTAAFDIAPHGVAMVRATVA